MENSFYYEYIESDGDRLFTCVCLPQKKNELPCVVMRSPYVDGCEQLDENEGCKKILGGNIKWLENGYAVVFQHCRGRGKSTGDFIPYVYERKDGLLLQSWIRTQGFYNGELYLVGGSYTASVHYLTAPFANDIKGAIFAVQDTERYNLNYRNGFFKIGLHGEWYVQMYKNRSIPKKSYTIDSYNMLPLSSFSKAVFGEDVDDFDEILRRPNKNDPFWKTQKGGCESHNAINNSNIPILLTTGFYDIYTGGVFDMWKKLDWATKEKSALVVHPYDHGGIPDFQPVRFENGMISEAFGDYERNWLNAIRGVGKFPFERGKVTYYNLFENRWHVDDFATPSSKITFTLGETEQSYLYDPSNPATFNGGLSANFGGTSWQNKPNLRKDIVTLYTPRLEKDVYVKGKISAKLLVKSSCVDTCFYVRISLEDKDGDYGLRDDINQISSLAKDYKPNTEIYMDFSFDEHAFLIKKGQRLRVDISSSALPHYVRHTNKKGLFSTQGEVFVAKNTVVCNKSTLTVPYSD